MAEFEDCVRVEVLCGSLLVLADKVVGWAPNVVSWWRSGETEVWRTKVAGMHRDEGSMDG
jgi:hypothetical protein